MKKARRQMHKQRRAQGDQSETPIPPNLIIEDRRLMQAAQGMRMTVNEIQRRDEPRKDPKDKRR